MMMGSTMAGVTVELLWWALAKAPLVLAGAALTAWVLRDASAATRHRVWATAVLATLALPLLTLLVPRLPLALPVEAGPASPPVLAGRQLAPLPPLRDAAVARAVVPAVPSVWVGHGGVHSSPVAAPVMARSLRHDLPSAHHVVAGAPPGTGTLVQASLAPDEPTAPSAGTVAVLLWTVVATGLLVRLAVDGMRTRRLERSYPDASADVLGRRVRRVAGEHGIRDVRVLLGARDAMPVTWGSRRPVLLLPEGAHAWPARRLEAVVRHELAHVRRGDVRLQLLADVLCAIHWFDPLAWYAAHRMRVEREHACDDEVLARGARPSDYASELVGLAHRFREPRVAGVAMARRGGLRARVESVLDERRRRGESRRARRGIQVAAGLVAALVAAFAPAAADLPPAAPVADSPVQLATLCWSDLREGSASVRRNDDDFELDWDRDDCAVDIRVTGELRFNDDFTRIVGISSGGRARFEERDGTRERRVEIRPAGGGIERRWWVDGDERPFDAEAERWLDAMLLNAFRSGGLATEQRAEWLVRSRGVDALLDELQYLRSDWVRGTYIMTALESPSLGDDRAVRLVREAAGTVGSDHTLMQILQTVATRRSLANAELRAAYIEAAAAIESDHARARSLEAALTGPSLPDRDLAAILDAVAGISSDHEKSELLVAVAERHRLTPELRAAYLRVTAAIESDHSTGRAAHALLDAGEPSPAEVALALDIAGEIESDHETGELLRRLGRPDLRDATQRERYTTALAGIESDHTLGAVLIGLMEERELDAATAGVVLRASSSIASDHTLGEVLSLLARRGGVTAETRAAFDAALASIDSRHTRSQVEEALRGR